MFRDKPPAYTNVKLLADGTPSYYFNPPTWARLRGCHVTHTALGNDKRAAYERVTKTLIPHFNSWLTNGESDSPVDRKPVIGTLEWLFLHHFITHRDFLELADSTRMVHERRLRQICNFEMTDGSLLGSWPLKSFSSEDVDGIYEALLARQPAVITIGKNGRTKKKQPGRTQANHIMKACRTAWNAGARSKSSVVPKDNPFCMRLRWRHETTYKATWDQLVQFVCTADRLGYNDIGTAALVIWEFCQRPTHAFAHLSLEHWRPDDHMNKVHILHPKTDEEMWLPLFDSTKKGKRSKLLYPDLAPRIEELCYKAALAGRVEGLMFVRQKNAKTSQLEGWAGKGDSISAVNRVVREIVAAAELPKTVTLESFRHGGITELGDADLTDTQIRLITRQNAKQLPTYIGPTQVQARLAQRKRLTRRAEKEEEITERIEIKILAR